jgi:hypothetical protein
VERHTIATPEPRVRQAVRAGGLTISLRDSRREFYIPCTITCNNKKWERGWFYLRNDGAGLPEDHVWFEDRWMVASLCDE